MGVSISDELSDHLLKPISILLTHAGELEVILGKRKGASEKLGRLKLLKKMMHVASIYGWKALEFYVAWVRRKSIQKSSSQKS